MQAICHFIFVSLQKISCTSAISNKFELRSSCIIFATD